MGTVLHYQDDLQIKRFWGGKERGSCVAISTSTDRYIEITKEEAKIVSSVLNKWLETH